MKNLTKQLLPLALVSVVSMTGAAYSQTKDAVIVIRHAEDADDWGAVGESQPADKKEGAKPWLSTAWSGANGVCTTWPEYHHPYDLIGDAGAVTDSNPDGLKVSLHGLSGVWEVWSQWGQHKDGTKATMKKRDQNGNEVKDKNGKTEKVSRTVPYIKDADGRDATAPLGESQAVKLAEKLDAFLAANGFSTVTKAITMNPQKDSDVDESKYGAATPNPFDTIWPFLKKRKDAGTSVNLCLVKRKGGDDMFPGIKAIVKGDDGAIPILDSGDSTIICWTGEAIESRDGKKGLLQYLSENFRPNDDTNWTRSATSRCADVVVFYKDPGDNQGVIERWIFNANTGEFTLRETKPGEKARLKDGSVFPAA